VAARGRSTSNHYREGGLEYGFQSLRGESGEDFEGKTMPHGDNATVHRLILYGNSFYQPDAYLATFASEKVLFSDHSVSFFGR
jgi:hypothetical protein